MGKECFPHFYTFGDMKARQQNFVVENDYFQYLLSCDEIMFEWTGLPDGIDKNRLEDFLNLTGGVVWKAIDGKHYVAPYPSRMGQIDQWGYGEIAHSTTLNGISLEGEVGKDAAIIYNNTVRAPQFDLFTTADIFTNIDTSSKINVRFSRVAPILQYTNDAQKEKMKELLKKVIEGEIDTIMSDSDKSPNIPFGQSEGVEPIEITSPDKIQYLQYLSQYFDIRMRRHFARRGLSLKTSDKQAQVTSDEVHGLDAVSWAYPLSKLQARKEGAEMVNKIYGTTISVEFSELWAQEYEAYKLRTMQRDTEKEGSVENAVETVENGTSAERDSDTNDG